MMNADHYEQVLEKLPARDVARAFAHVLALYTERGFGSATKADLDAAMFDALVSIHAFDVSNDVSLMRELRLTRARLTRLREMHELRHCSEQSLDKSLRELLARPVTIVSEGTVRFRVRSVLLRAHIQSVLAAEGCATDGSFARDLVAVDARGLSVLVSRCWSDRERNLLQARLHALNGDAPQTTLTAWLTDKVVPGLLVEAMKAAAPGAELAQRLRVLVSDVVSVAHTIIPSL